MLPGVTTLSESLTRVLGPRTGKPLDAIFGLRTVGDLLRHYPRRYYTRGELTDLSSLREGDHVTVLARVVTVAEIPLPPVPGKGRRSRLEVVVTDDRAKLILTFFSGIGRYRRVLRPDVVGMFAGTVSSFRGRRQLVHPECEMLPGAPPNADLNAGAGRRVRRRDDPRLPGQRQVQLLADRQVGQDRAGHAGRGGGPAAGRAQGARGAVRPGRGAAGHPPAAGPGRPEAGARSGSSGTRRSCCRPRWRSGGWRPPPCRPCPGRTWTAASPTSSTPGCRSRSPTARSRWARPSPPS